MKAKDQAREVRKRLHTVMVAETELLEIVLDTNRVRHSWRVWSKLDEGERNAIQRRVAIPVELKTQE